MPHRFLRFKTGTVDTIWCDDRRAFLLDVPDGPSAFIDGICPHRGGPLALGHYDCATVSLRCPWHGRRHGRRQLLARAWPSLRVGDDWVVALPPASDDAGDVLPGEAASAICFRRDRLSVE